MIKKLLLAGVVAASLLSIPATAGAFSCSYSSDCGVNGSSYSTTGQVPTIYGNPGPSLGSDEAFWHFMVSRGTTVTITVQNNNPACGFDDLACYTAVGADAFDVPWRTNVPVIYQEAWSGLLPPAEGPSPVTTGSYTATHNSEWTVSVGASSEVAATSQPWASYTLAITATNGYLRWGLSSQSTPAPSYCPQETGNLGQRLLAYLKCNKSQAILAAKCMGGVTLLVLPSKILKLMQAARLTTVLAAVPKFLRSTATLAYHLLHVKIWDGSQVGFRTRAQAIDTLMKMKTARDVIQALPKLARAMSKADYNQIALDIANIGGLLPCVEGFAGPPPYR